MRGMFFFEQFDRKGSFRGRGLVSLSGFEVSE
jgi:hypothetical protein